MKSIWKYKQLLEPVDEIHRIMLGEGQTPLVKSHSIGREIGIPELYFKLENTNPTGSYKDRFAAKFISLLKSRSVNACFATSSGNTGAALAAYSAAANIQCILAIVDGAPEEKIKQIRIYGATTYMIKGFGKDIDVTNNVFKVLESAAASLGVALPVSAYCYCSEGMEGVQTIAYEIMEETDGNIEHIFCPAGGGGLTLAVARGAIRYADHTSGKAPHVHCVQPEGNDTIASAIRRNTRAKEVSVSKTTISGLQVPGILDGDEVIKTLIKLNGSGFLVTDEEVLRFRRKLALQEGIFCEPAGAVALAGAARAIQNGEINKDEPVVCLITGSGFKDMISAEKDFNLNKTEKLDNTDQLISVLDSLKQ